jgi:hypothetical protein
MLLLRVEVVDRTCQVERLQKKESETGTQVWKGKARARDRSRHLGLSVRTALHCVVYRRAGDAKSDCNFRRCCCAVVLHTHTLSLLCNRNAAVDKNGMVFLHSQGPSWLFEARVRLFAFLLQFIHSNTPSPEEQHAVFGKTPVVFGLASSAY